MVWAGISIGQRTPLHFIEGNLNGQRYRDEIMIPIVVPFVRLHAVTFQQDNARPHVARICMQLLEAEHIQVLEWPAYSPDMSPIEHLWDVLDLRIRQRVPVPGNVRQLRVALEEEGNNIQQATIDNLVNTMRRRCAALRDANGGHTRY
jgi:transposase